LFLTPSRRRRHGMVCILACASLWAGGWERTVTSSEEGEAEGMTTAGARSAGQKFAGVGVGMEETFSSAPNFFCRSSRQVILARRGPCCHL